MKPLLLCAILALSACTTTRSQRQTERYYARRPELATAVLAMKTAKLQQDSLAAALPPPVEPVATPGSIEPIAHTKPAKPSLLRRIFPAKAPKPAVAAQFKKCKGCTIVYGTATVTTVGKKATAAIGEAATATVTGKKSGPAVIASDSTTQNVAGANAQQTTTTGDNNQVSAKKQDTTQEAPGALAAIADNLTGWVPYAAGGAILLLLFVLWRKKKQAENIIS